MVWRIFRRGTGPALALAMGLAVPAGVAVPHAGASPQGPWRAADAALGRALARLVRHADGPPGIAVVVQRGNRVALYRAGVADLAGRAPIRMSDSMRLASVSKAFSGAVALSLVADGILRFGDTVGSWLPGLPRAWSKVTLRELLQHTSGIPDYSQTERFKKALLRSPDKAPPPRVLLSYAPKKRNFTPGSRYAYSNSDNVIVALMAEAASAEPYTTELRQRVFGPLRLAHTGLPRGTSLPGPFVHGYAPDPPHVPADVTHLFAAGWAWASGGVVSTPYDTDAFIRAYVRGATTNAATRRAQFSFRPGSSEPPGPGRNATGLAIFRYRTRCGTVYGHTGNTAGYTQLAAASQNGKRSVVVSVNAQITPAIHPARFRELRQIYALAVCAALAR